MRTFIVAALVAIFFAPAPGHAATCVTQDAYSQLSLGQTMREQRLIVDVEPNTSFVNGRIRRTYPMCFVLDGSNTLHTRYEMWEGNWRAIIVDPNPGPASD